MIDREEADRVIHAFGREILLIARGPEASAVRPPAQPLRIYACDGLFELYTGVDVINAADREKDFDRAESLLLEEDHFDSVGFSPRAVLCTGGSHAGRYLPTVDGVNERRVQNRDIPGETELYVLATNAKEGPLYIFEKGEADAS
jgi:hypothetical protein